MRADALLDGELGVLDRIQMRMHLLMCKGCAAFVAQMQATRRLGEDAIGLRIKGPEDSAQIAEILRKARAGPSGDQAGAAPENEGTRDEKPQS